MLFSDFTAEEAKLIEDALWEHVFALERFIGDAKKTHPPAVLREAAHGRARGLRDLLKIHFPQKGF
jgi:hypothetical protein